MPCGTVICRLSRVAKLYRERFSLFLMTLLLEVFAHNTSANTSLKNKTAFQLSIGYFFILM